MDDRSAAADKPYRLSFHSRGRRKTLTILLLLFGGTLALLALASHSIILESFANLERQNRRNQLDQFASLLAGELDQLGRTAGDYAGWDEAYRFVQNGNRRFIDVNLDEAIFSQLRLNLLAYVDTGGRIRYAKAFDYQRGKEIPFPPALKKHLHPDSRLLARTGIESRVAGVLSLPEGLLLTVARPVLKSDYSGPLKGTLILGRFLDRPEIERLEGVLQSPVEVFAVTATLPADVRAALPILRRQKQHTRAAGSEKIAGYALFPDLFGKEGFVVKVEGARLYYQQGQKEVRWFLFWAAAIGGGAGFAIFTLIDRVKAGKQRLLQANSLLEGIVSGSEDPIAAVDADFRYLVFNRAYAEDYRRFFGAEVRTGGSLITALAHLPCACDMEKRLWQRALGGETFTITGEWGDPQVNQRTFETKFTPLRDRDGAVVAAACIARDMTERLREERTLRESEQRFRVFFNNVAVGTIQLNSAGYFTRVNDRFCLMTGYSREELQEMTPQDLAIAEEEAGQREPFWRFLHGEASSYRAEKRYRRKDGKIIWVEIAAGAVRDETGRLLRTVGMVQDITERKYLEEELRGASQAAEAASRAKSEFLATMSHEIRTPMTVFMVALEHLLEIDHQPERRQFLEMADGAARRLRILIDDILDFSRIEAGRLEVEEEPFDLRECVGRVVDLLALSALEKGLRLETRIAADLPPLVMGDSDRIEQVLINLLGNAVKFTETGEIEIAVEVCSSSLRISVSDTGIGVPEGKRDLLFHHFSQVDSSTTRRHGGTGLGLAICKGLVDLMGGRIGFQNREGGGSLFFFTLPLKPAAPAGEEEGLAELAAAVGNADARILLAEDEPTVRAMMQMLLQQNGWQIDLAENGAEAVERWRQGRHQLIFMDIAMPGTDGLEATRQIRRQAPDDGRRPRIIGLTAHADKETEKSCIAAGMDDCLAKPVRMGELFAAIDRCFRTTAEATRRLAQGE